MIKRINLVVAAIAVLAVAIPVTASASTGLSNSGGVLLPVGSLFKGYNTTTWTLEELGVGKLTCNAATLAGQITKNNAAEGVEAKEAGATVNQTCFQNGSTKFEVDNVVLGGLKSAADEPGKAIFSLSYLMHIGSLNCKFVLKNDVATYGSGGSLLTITKQPQTVSPAACGSAGRLTVTYKLQTQSAQPEAIIIH